GSSADRIIGHIGRRNHRPPPQWTFSLSLSMSLISHRCAECCHRHRLRLRGHSNDIDDHHGARACLCSMNDHRNIDVDDNRSHTPTTLPTTTNSSRRRILQVSIHCHLVVVELHLLCFLLPLSLQPLFSLIFSLLSFPSFY